MNTILIGNGLTEKVLHEAEREAKDYALCNGK